MCIDFHAPSSRTPPGPLQERAWVSGLAAANLVVSHLGEGEAAKILPGECVSQAPFAV